MTDTRRWLERQRGALVRRHAGAGMLLTTGLVLAVLAAGVGLGALGIYQRAPAAVLTAWLAALAAAAWGFRWYGRRVRRSAVHYLADEVERRGKLRRGSIGGAAAWEPASGSAALAAAADRHAARWLQGQGRRALAGLRGEATRSVWLGALTLLLGVSLFAVSFRADRARAFWRPLAILAARPGGVSIAVDRVEVRRGDSDTVEVRAPGERTATLWSRAPGEPWGGRTLELDSVGRAVTVVGPLESDRYLRAVSGNRSSDTLHVRVALPAFIAELHLLARYPEYLGRPDDPLVLGPDAVWLPVGTRIATRGEATVPLSAAAWELGDSAVRRFGGSTSPFDPPIRRSAEPPSVSLAVDDRAFEGTLAVWRSGRWRLRITPAGGGSLDEPAPELTIVAVPDSVPVVTVPVPGADTTAPLSLAVPLVVDARDDHALTRVELVSWRVTRLGERREPAAEPIPLPEGGTERAVLQWVLDLNGRGFLPGDTAYFKVRAADDAPVPQVGESRVFALRLPAMAELREAMRRASEAVAVGADSLATAQGELARSIEELAAERERGTADGSLRGAAAAGEQLPFSSVERARELGERQSQALERARELRDQLRELQESAWNAGLTDPEFHEQLRELRELLERAVTEEMAERLRALRDALERLDAEGAREALERLAEAARELREELERGRELFERAALEGEMTTLAQDADELARLQQEWNRQAGRSLDRHMAEAERDLAARADSLALQLGQLGASLDTLGPLGEVVSQAGEQSAEASEHMRQAAQQASRGGQDGARQSGQAASEALDPLGQRLREQRDRLREGWRREVLEAMDRALVEAADLAQRQEQVAQRLARGESSGDLRGEQAAVRDGVDRVIQRVQGAAGKNALVSPQLGTALGFSRLRMDEALQQLQRAVPNSRQAAELAGQAVDALNAVAHALLRTRAEVSGAQSGSGLEEALERMAQLAEQQGAINSQSGQLQPILAAGGRQVLQQLREMAERQRALANELDRLNAQGDVSGADQLAEQARDIARDLEAGRLDPETVERQERLYHRLLDAGRTLRKDEEDDRKERVSQTADPTVVRRPAAGPVSAAGGPRFRYPTWEELQSLSPEERRLILDYFRRLNDGRR